MPIKKRLEVISLGDELLLGLRDNSHLTYLGKELARKGIVIQRDQEIRDSTDDIKHYVQETWNRVDVLITTGGLGPTVDDVTREAVAEALGCKLVYDETVEQAIRERFARHNRVVTENNLKQAYVLEGAEVLPNPNGTAPGMWLEKDGKILIMMPGPGHEMRPMFIDYVLPRLEAKDIAFTNDAYLQIRTCGVGESQLETMLQPIFNPHAEDLNVAYCVHEGIVDIRLGSTGLLPWQTIEQIGEQCRDALDMDFLGYGDVTHGELIFKYLRSREKTFSVAESCTGGLISSAFTDLAGVSKVFLGGLVCYNNDVKTTLLGVPDAIITQHGAVSPECAVAMATAAQERFESDYALSITGYAGPTGGNKDNPVGTIYMGYCSPYGVWSHKIHIPGTRIAVRQKAAVMAMDWVRRKLLKYQMHDLLEDLAM